MTQQLIFIDSRVTDHASLTAHLPEGSAWFVLDPSRDGVAEMARIAARFQGLEAIHVLAHGDVGRIELGNAVLDLESAANYRSELHALGQALQEGGDLLLYGCNVGAGERGRQFVETLAQSTGADVAASEDTTGAAARGGDWHLEIVSRQGLIGAAPLRFEAYPDTLGFIDIVNKVSRALDLFNSGVISAASYAAKYVGTTAVRVAKEMTLGTGIFALELADLAGADNLLPGDTLQTAKEYLYTLDDLLEKNVEQKMMLSAANDLIAFSYVYDGIPLSEQNDLGRFKNWDDYVASYGSSARVMDISTEAIAQLRAAVTKKLLDKQLGEIATDIKEGAKNIKEGAKITKDVLQNSINYLKENGSKALDLMSKTADAILMNQSNNLNPCSFVIDQTQPFDFLR